MLSQTSGDLATEPAQVCAPPVHVYVEVLQRVPVPLLVQSALLPVEQQVWLNHGSVSSAAPSVVPLQLSSLPLHTSAVRGVSPTQVSVPAVQFEEPALQMPVPHLPEVQQALPVRPSSVWPLQLSSTELQISATGPTCCVQVRPLTPPPLNVPVHFQ